MERRMIERAVGLGGLSLPDDLEFEVVGEEPVLPSPHYLATGGAAARILTGVGASELWRRRTGRPQALSVDARHAAASLRAHRVTEFLDDDRAPRETPIPAWHLTTIMPALHGRYMQMHASFRDAARALDELGLGESASPEEAQAAVAQRDAFELEDAFVRRGICGGVVRTKEEWAAHPQGQALAGWPLVQITKIGEAPPEPLPEGDRPTSGIRVLDLTRVLAGPVCAQTLAEHGADVLHVSAPSLPTREPIDVTTGFGKRQVAIDLNEPKQAELMRELARETDVFLQGFRLGTLAKRGFGPEQLAELRPGIVYVSENCYGHDGPWAERPGWEQLAESATGMTYREGQAAEDGVPRLAPAAVNDYGTAFLAAYGTMMALARRADEGGSWHVQVSLSRTSMWYLALGDDNDYAHADEGDQAPFFEITESPDFGRVRHVKPALAMSETEPRWDLPPVRPGAHEPVWLPR